MAVSIRAYSWEFGGIAAVGGAVMGAAAFWLDRANKYLYQSFVESPDMMNVYNGNATTDENGNAIIKLPDYFEALNRDFRYQLTVIGQFAQAIIAEKIKDNRFAIKTDKPDIEVSWQVTVIRQDKFANENRILTKFGETKAERLDYFCRENRQANFCKEKQK